MRFKPLCIGVTKCHMVSPKARELYLVLLGWGSSYILCKGESLSDIYRMCQESHPFCLFENPHSICGFHMTIIMAVLPKDLKLPN